jgi:hypothetical protein
MEPPAVTNPGCHWEARGSSLWTLECVTTQVWRLLPERSRATSFCFLRARLILGMGWKVLSALRGLPCIKQSQENGEANLCDAVSSQSRRHPGSLSLCSGVKMNPDTVEICSFHPLTGCQLQNSTRTITGMLWSIS